MIKSYGTARRAMGVTVLMACSAAACAADYRFEASASYDRETVAGSFFENTDTMNLAGAWYFEPVSTEGVPLAEAAFLGRASRVSAVLARIDVLGTHLNAQAASVGYYFPDSMFYASAGLSRVENITAISSTVIEKDHRTAWSGQLGIAPLEGLLITTRIEEGGYEPNITARHVGKLSNSRFYAGSVTLVEPDVGDTFIALDFDYYLNSTASVGLGYADGAERWEIRGQKFFSERWALAASLHTDDFGDGVGVRITWRH
jgi:hypothetical protein